jgi:hypothetical protein
MKTVRVFFSDFWPDLIQNDNYFFNLLSLKYNVVIDEVNPDIVFHSVYTKNHLKYDMNKCIKILYTGENRRPNFNESHYSVSFDYMDDNRNYRLPLWALIFNWFDRPYNADRDHAYLHDIHSFLNKKLWSKNKFCAFVVSNPNCSRRLDFARKVASYKMIDCPGRIFTNVPPIMGRGDQVEKVEFLRDYKFNICFENSTHQGYCTEKIIHSMFMNTLPIYWGDPLVTNDFNKDSFLNSHDFQSDGHLLEKIIELDNNPTKYKEIMEQPWFIDNKIPDFIKPESVLSFFEKIID